MLEPDDKLLRGGFLELKESVQGIDLVEIIDIEDLVFRQHDVGDHSIDRSKIEAGLQDRPFLSFHNFCHIDRRHRGPQTPDQRREVTAKAVRIKGPS
jgi:hypothetical protein